MDVVHARCAGLDISKKDAKVCVRVAEVGRRRAVETVSTWGSTTNSVWPRATLWSPKGPRAW